MPACQSNEYRHFVRRRDPVENLVAEAGDRLAHRDDDLKANVKMFGRETTKQGAALMLLMDQHEHLGQSIAYARSNNVVPPGSK